MNSISNYQEQNSSTRIASLINGMHTSCYQKKHSIEIVALQSDILTIFTFSSNAFSSLVIRLHGLYTQSEICS